MPLNQLRDPPEFAGTQALAGINCCMLQPEFRNLFVGCNVNAWWLPRITFVAEKEEPTGTFPQDRWHLAFRKCSQAHCRPGECRGVGKSRTCARSQSGSNALLGATCERSGASSWRSAPCGRSIPAFVGTAFHQVRENPVADVAGDEAGAPAPSVAATGFLCTEIVAGRGQIQMS